MKVQTRYAAPAVILLLSAGVTAAFAVSAKSHSPAPVKHPAAVTSTLTECPYSHLKTASCDEPGEKEDEKNEAPLSAAVSSDAAIQAALAAHPGGKAGKAELENEDGKAVYGVAVTAANGKKYDVKVDGNSGKVLKSEADDEDEKGDGDENENEDDD